MPETARKTARTARQSVMGERSEPVVWRRERRASKRCPGAMVAADMHTPRSGTTPWYECARPSRNDRRPCGSELKFKVCCTRLFEERAVSDPQGGQCISHSMPWPASRPNFRELLARAGKLPAVWPTVKSEHVVHVGISSNQLIGARAPAVRATSSSRWSTSAGRRSGAMPGSAGGRCTCANGPTESRTASFGTSG